MISIIIPFFNAKKTIYSAIESCLEQLYTDIEILLINDGSTEDIDKNELLSLSSKIRYFYQENTGTGPARNLGMKEARGEYIFFLDADDSLEVNALNSLHVSIQSFDFVHAKCKRVFMDKDEKVYKEEIWKKAIHQGALNKYTLVVDTISTNKLYRREFLDKHSIGFGSGEHEDIAFVVKLYDISDNFTFLDQVVYRWNVRDAVNTRSSRLSIQTLQTRIDVLKKCILEIKDEKLKTVMINNAIAHDLKRYVLKSEYYSKDEIEVLYTLYADFVEQYGTYIKKSFLKASKEESIKHFMNLSRSHNAGKLYLKKVLSHSMYIKIHKLNLLRKRYLR